uniref:Uncharacterized protein n=1 Tax=Rhizophora mucronata TaxID=61149 RepID=A0A2P2QZP4_RHIMU
MQCNFSSFQISVLNKNNNKRMYAL